MSQATTKVNLGCVLQRVKGWVNIDPLDMRDLAVNEGVTFIQHDPRKPLPFQPDSVDAMYSGFFFHQYHPFFELIPMLRDCRKILKKGAILRILGYNLDYYLKVYSQAVEGDPVPFNELGKRVHYLFPGIKSLDLKLSLLLLRNWDWQNCREFWTGNQVLFTNESLKELLQVAGFTKIETMPFGLSGDPIIQAEAKDLFQEHNPVIMEASK